MNATQDIAIHKNVLSEIPSLQSQFDVFRFLRRMVELFGYRVFIVFKIPPATSLLLSENCIITNWPADFLGSYDRLVLLPECPLMPGLRRSIVPVPIDFAQLAASYPVAQRDIIAELYRAAHLKTGVAIPVGKPDGTRCVMMIAGERDAITYREMVELTMIAIHGFQRLVEVTADDGKQPQILTDREVDCLTWTAAGKTSADIATILTLSEHTVNHYLNRAAKKLDTVNRTQAVAKALRRGLIK
jgi:LuxR family transcriptional regulator, quorum-sensing system regulator BjaR1